MHAGTYVITGFSVMSLYLFVEAAIICKKKNNKVRPRPDANVNVNELVSATTIMWTVDRRKLQLKARNIRCGH